jgi:hypothetical protein
MISKACNGKLTIETQSNGITKYFSYSTLVAFSVNGKLTISKNEWSKTTARHLNYINPDQTLRIPHSQIMILAKELGIA